MPDLKEAIAQVQRFAPFMQAVIDLAATAETLSGAERAVAEKQSLLSGLDAEIEDAKAALAKAKADGKKALEAAQGNAAELEAEAHQARDESVAASKRADHDARIAIDAARGEAKRLVDEANGKVAEAEAKVAAAQAELAAIEAKADAARKQITDAQAKFAKVLEG